MNEQLNRNYIVLGIAIFAGIGLRFWAMSIGSGFDFESYCIVGRLVNEGKNVYAETTRYNYGPVFFMIQGFCYWLAHFLSIDIIATYRVLIVSVLTLADIGIMFYIMTRYSLKLGIVFFLNPVSIIITGFHNQFDNIAVFLVLCSCCFYNEEEKINRRDFLFVLFMALSLVTKHVLFMVPIWLFVKKGLTFKKRILYSVIPVFIFLLSFIPFMIGNMDAVKGVLYNVFLYRSSAFGMLIDYACKFLRIPLQFYFIIFVLSMSILALITRKQEYEYQIMIYLLAQVVFASAAAPQYLIIPIVALCVGEKRTYRYMYFLLAGLYLFIGEFRIANFVVNDVLKEICNFVIQYGYAIASLVLLFMLFYEVVNIVCNRNGSLLKP